MSETEHVDVVIVGAGISGIDAAYRLQTMCPGKSYVILEARDRLGGTWDLFRYPGIRSDSDMYTLGFPFAPWTEETAIADGATIWAYLDRTARAYGIDRRIRYGSKVVAQSWDSGTASWTLDIVTTDGRRRLTTSFVHSCTGYYSFDRGYTPDYPGREVFRGRLVHPQLWPEGLDVAGRRVVVVGSGATAMTLVPALALKGADVTMLQRSPTYVISQPDVDPLAKPLTRALGAERASTVLRWKNVVTSTGFYRLCRRRPRLARRLLLGLARKPLREAGVDERHFSPRYNPWDQRLCVVPNGDLFRALASGKAHVVTDTIDTFVPEGIRTTSGDVILADIVVSATGLCLLIGGGTTTTVDGERVDVADRFAYRGLMIEGVPNATMSIGYVNASWTLRADLVAQYVCRLINRIDERHAAYAYAKPPAAMQGPPLLDLTAGYVQRGLGALPKQGDRRPWTVEQSYLTERRGIGRADIDEDMVFVPARVTVPS